MQRIAKSSSLAEINNKLDELPDTLDGMYVSIFQAIEKQSSSFGTETTRVLSWIFRAKRPLLVRELQQATTTFPGKRRSAELKYPEAAHLVDCCLGLVTIDERSIIRFVHFSVQEFLEQKSYLLDTDCTIASTCLYFLCFDNFATGECASHEALRELLRDVPFLEYAASYWVIHGKGCSEPDFVNLALKFLSSEPHLACAAQVAGYGGRSSDGSGRALSQKVSGLHVVASFGLESLALALLEDHRISVDVLDDHGQTPILYAAKQGHTAMVELLASRGAEVDKKDSMHHRTALSWATLNGHTAVAKWLLYQNPRITINSFDYQHSTPLHIAFERHHYDIVDLLVAQGASLNLVDQWQRTPAQLAFSGSSLIDLSNYVKEKSLTNAIAQGGQARVSVFKRHGHCHTSLVGRLHDIPGYLLIHAIGSVLLPI
jgi:Ankyrin repeats (3 copies)/Ankyrin repeats (many copies)